MYRGLLLSFLLFAGAVQAQQRLQITGDVRHTTKPAESTMLVEGALLDVARQISPKGWTGFASKTVNPSRQSSVQIQKGQMWTDVLAQWLEAEGLTARVDATRRFVLLDAPAQDPVTAAAPAGGRPAVAETAAQPQGTRWEVRVEDVTLEATFKRWAKQANYQLLWDSEREVLLPGADVYVGSFEDAVDRALGSPAVRESDHPLHAVIYANNPPLMRVTRLGDK